MTSEYAACLETVPYRKGDRWYYETGTRSAPNPVIVVIETIDFAVSENGSRPLMFGRYVDETERAVDRPIPLFWFNFVEKVEAVGVPA